MYFDHVVFTLQGMWNWQTLVCVKNLSMKGQLHTHFVVL